MQRILVSSKKLGNSKVDVRKIELKERKMKSRSKPIISQLLTLLRDETRLAIFIHLLVYKTLTLKQLSEYIGKGKTTIHHHIRKFEKKNIVEWDEEKQDRKTLKTRHYSISHILNVELNENDLTLEKMELNRLISSRMSKLMIDYTRKRPNFKKDEYMISPISFIPNTKEALQLCEDFITKMSLLNQKKELDKNHSLTAPNTHFISHFIIPIREILDWKLKHNTDVE